MHDFVRQVLRRFSKDERGNVFILFGATAIPLMLIMGGAVDVTRYLRYKGDLSNAVDSAALALARQDPDATEEEAETFISDYVNAFAVGDTEFSVEDFEVVKVDNGFQVTASGAMQTMFLPLGQFTSGGGHGINEMPVNITAEVVNQSNRLEVALVLDNTGSMNCAGVVSSCALNWSAPAADSRITALKTAAKSLVDILMEDDMDDPDQIKIALVPFETAVNVASAATGDLGTVANWPSWIDNNVGTGSLANWNGRNFDKWNQSSNAACTSGTNCKVVGHRWLFDKLKADKSTVKWAGCVEMRAGTYELSDAAPTSSIKDSLYVPYFAPDEPDTNSIYTNNYLVDTVTGTAAVRQKSVNKYKNNSSIQWQSGMPDVDATSSPYESGPNKGCPKPIVPLTNADGKATVKTAIDGMIAYWHAGTYIPAGLVWGWHVLTSGEPYTQGIAPSHEDYEDTVKAIVLLTDGDNQIEPGDDADNHNKSNYTAYSYVKTVDGSGADRLSTTASASEGDLDTKLGTLCTSVKQNNTPADTTDDIRLYTITFGSLSAAVQTMMQNCATLDEGERLHYHAPTSAQLDAIFTEIGEDLREIHLSM
jgi:Flp pilus assembly protein TadG